jgi:putative CocE/NonD family hydrolase
LKKPRDDFNNEADTHSTVNSEIPEKFTPKTDSFDYVRREEMVPMRDGVKLYTVILTPKEAQDTPIVLTRTPYNASGSTLRFNSPNLSSVVPQINDTTSAERYIIVYQDVRGKYSSEGDYVMNKPLIGPLNANSTDHSTDSYDTIDWLVKNVAESNGRVAVIGGSYKGFTTLMSTINPHPALKAVVPFAAMVDGWIGDDWFHWGAFRQEVALTFAYNQQATRKSVIKWWSGCHDTYESFLRAGNAGAVAASRGMESIGFWQKLAAHTAYDSFWQEQAVDKLLAKHPLTVPMLIVGGLFDEQDIYGSPALYKALSPKDPNGKFVHLVLGPWNHAQGRRDARSLGLLEFEGNTSGWFRRKVMQPFLDHYLKDAPKPDIPRVLVYETGSNVWHHYYNWPPTSTDNYKRQSRNLYLQKEGRLGFEETPTEMQAFDEYVSDPAKPVPYRERSKIPKYAESPWGDWLVDDQRHAASRTDVLVWKTEPLKEPIRVAGEPIARLFASTSGSDSDWVVKIIDVWPDEVPENPKLSGYQQMLSADIFRGRYREDLAVPKPLIPGKVLEYRIPLPHVSHTFLSGHRIMVHVQSSWFPLYDRNPQTFVPNIMFAPPESYQKATQRVWRTTEFPTMIELPLIS